MKFEDMARQLHRKPITKAAVDAVQDFNEGDHPRARNGEFGSGGKSGKSSSSAGKSLGAKEREGLLEHIKAYGGLGEAERDLSPADRRSLKAEAVKRWGKSVFDI
jgi:hypothetical protein